MTRHHLHLALFGAIAAQLVAGSASGKDVFVTLGGGPEATANQVSLEKNVEFFSRTLSEHYPQPFEHHVLFADGAAPLPDLQYVDESVEVSEAVRWMNRIIGDDEPVQLRYRNHHPFDGEQPADREHVKSLLQSLATEMVAGDRLVMYVTAHGGPATPEHAEVHHDASLEEHPPVDALVERSREGDGADAEEADAAKANAADETLLNAPRDTSILLWGGDELRVSELTGWLDGFSPEVEIVVVMVQCYSGGFADMVFRKADRRGGLSERPRCGFFSQRHDRAAAGCTPEIDESDYQEYSSFFWAALAGETRSTGQAIDADYDDDGRVSFAEAHAYATIVSDTIDVPVRTSDVLLRRYSRIDDERRDVESPGVVSSLFGRWIGDDQPDQPVAAMVTMHATIEETLAIARPDQRAIIEQLAIALELDHTTSARELRRQVRRLGRAIDSRYEEIAAIAPAEQTLIESIRDSLHQHHPAFNPDGYSPLVTEWTSERAEEFVEIVEALEESQALLHVEAQLDAKMEAAETLELKEAKLERLFRTLQSVLLEANLPSVADQPTVERFQSLIELENGSLWPPS